MGGGTAGSTTAPTGYIADSQGPGAIMMDARIGPMWVDEEKDSRQVNLDPEETTWREDRHTAGNAEAINNAIRLKEAKAKKDIKAFMGTDFGSTSTRASSRGKADTATRIPSSLPVEDLA